MNFESIFNKIKSQSFRINLCYTLSLMLPFYNKCNINQLLSSFPDIEKIISMKIPNVILFFSNNKNNIHDILYEEEEIIEINDYNLKNLADSFYVDLLIKNNLDIIDYCLKNLLQ